MVDLITETPKALTKLGFNDEQIKYAMENICFECIKNIETSVEKAIILIYDQGY